jgi:sorting nexin-13
VSIIGYKQYRRSAKDMYYFLQVSKIQYFHNFRAREIILISIILFGVLQSNVCVKQLAYAMLEQALVTIFPELRQLIDDIHEKGRKEQASFTYQL